MKENFKEVISSIIALCKSPIGNEISFGTLDPIIKSHILKNLIENNIDVDYDLDMNIKFNLFGNTITIW
jgi:hypothetical protein